MGPSRTAPRPVVLLVIAVAAVACLATSKAEPPELEADDGGPVLLDDATPRIEQRPVG